MSAPIEKEASKKVDAASLEQRAVAGDDLRKDLDQIPWDDRLKVAQEMDKLNEQRRVADPTLPDLKIETAKGKNNDEYLAKITLEKQEKDGEQKGRGENPVQPYSNLAVETFKKLDRHGYASAEEARKADYSEKADQKTPPDGYLSGHEIRHGIFNAKDEDGKESLSLTESEAALADVLKLGFKDFVHTDEDNDKGISLGDLVYFAEQNPERFRVSDKPARAERRR